MYNLQLKNGVDAKELLRYGFKPKYSEETGEVIEYSKHFNIDNSKEKHFTFILCREYKLRLFKRIEVKGWMSGFDWDAVTSYECIKMLYDLIINGIIEPVEKSGV